MMYVPALVMQSALEGFTAVDLLTGAVLLMVILLLRWVADLRRDTAAIVEWKQHVPTKDEVRQQITDTRHTLRNEIQAFFSDAERKLNETKDYFDSRMTEQDAELSEIARTMPRRKGEHDG